jgi:invasin C
MSMVMLPPAGFQPAPIKLDLINSVKCTAEESSDKKPVDIADICLFTAVLSPATGKPLLTAPLLSPDPEWMQDQLTRLQRTENTDRLDDLRIARFITPEQIEEALTLVLQREWLLFNKVGHRTLTKALPMDDDALHTFASALQLTLVNSLLQERNTQPVEQQDTEDSIPFGDVTEQSRFVGIQTTDMMRFLLSVLRQVMAELNISERRINTLFSELSAAMTYQAADSTIKEGKDIFKGALMGFCAAVMITAAGSGLQVRSLHKQNQMLKPPLPRGKSNAKQSQKSIKDAEKKSVLSAQRHDEKINKYRIQNSIAEQVVRSSDTTAQLVNASNMIAVKGDEAAKMVESNIAETAHSIAVDITKQGDKTEEEIKTMRNFVNGIHKDTTHTNQALIRG